MKRTWGLVPILITLVVAGCGSSNSTPTHTSTKPVTSASFLSSLKQASNVASTVPANGDVNPYGIAQGTSSAGKLQAGQFLVSNFNDKANDQGTGTTIVQVSEAGTPSLFAQIKASSLPGACPGGGRVPGVRDRHDRASHQRGGAVLHLGREPADDQRHVSNCQVRLPDRAQ